MIEMKNLNEIKKILEENKAELRKRFRVKKIGVFGSYARNEQKNKSDLDILVEFSEPIGLFEFMDLEDYLVDLVGVKIDLVSKKALKPNIGKQILSEVAYV